MPFKANECQQLSFRRQFNESYREVLAAVKPCSLRTDMLIFITISKKNDSVSSTSVEQGTSFLKKFWL